MKILARDENISKCYYHMSSYAKLLGIEKIEIIDFVDIRDVTKLTKNSLLVNYVLKEG